MSIDRNSPDYNRYTFDYSAHFVRLDADEDRMYMSFRVEFNDLWVGEYVAHPAMQRWMYNPDDKTSYSEDLTTPLVFTANGVEQDSGVTRYSAFFDFTMGPNFLGFEMFSYDPNPDAEFYRHILWGVRGVNGDDGGGGDSDSTSTSTPTSTDTSTSTSTSTPPTTTTDELAVKTELITVSTSKVTGATAGGVTWS